MSSQSASYTFSKWYMYGSGWSTSYQASCTVTVTRNYGSDIATITVSNAKMYTYGGDTSRWRFYLKIGNGSWQYWDLSNGWHGAETWYNYGSHSWTTSVGAGSGNLNLTICFNAYDTNNNISADSEYKYPSLWYDTKGASTISSATNVQLNTSGTATSTVTFVSYSSSFTHKVKATLGSVSTSEVTVSGGNSVTKTATLTFPASFINAINTAKTGTATVTLTTYSGSTSIGSSTKNITLTVPSGINPTVTINSVTKSAKVTNSFTEICTVLDAVTVGWSFTQSYSSSINSGSVNVDGTSGSNTSGTYTSGILTNYGTRTVTVTATDKRGNSGSASQTFNVYRYFYPSLSMVKFKTNNSLDIAGNIAYVNGSNVPSLVLKIYKGESTSGITVDLGSYIGSARGETCGESYSFNFNYPIPSSYIPDIATETYHFEVIVGDSITTATTTVYSAVAVMTFGAGGTNITAHKPLILDSSFNFSIQGAIQTASWTASSSTATLTILTQDLTLTKGVWLILARVPEATANNTYTFRTGSGTTDIDQQNYFLCDSYGMGAILVTVSSDTATVRLQTGYSQSTSYSQTARGGLQAIRLR